MKTLAKLLIFFLCVGMLSACTTNKQRQEKYNRKIYLTEEDYLEDLMEDAAKERREAPAQVESDYIFNIQPQVSDNVYFFDQRQQPKVPGQPAVSEYKKEKRLWTKPRRYSPDEYYGMQDSGSGGSSTSSRSGGSSSYSEESYSSSYY